MTEGDKTKSPSAKAKPRQRKKKEKMKESIFGFPTDTVVILGQKKTTPKLKKLRTDNGLTQTQVTKALSLSQSMYSEVERGQRVVTVDAAKFARAFKKKTRSKKTTLDLTARI